MDQVLALRPFVPARDFALSKRFHQALGFALTHDAGGIAFLKLGGFSFILQDFHVQAAAENLMLQVLVRDVAVVARPRRRGAGAGVRGPAAAGAGAAKLGHGGRLPVRPLRRAVACRGGAVLAAGAAAGRHPLYAAQHGGCLARWPTR